MTTETSRGRDEESYTNHAAIFRGQRVRKPLIEYVTNEWQHDPRHHASDLHEFSDDGEDFVDRLEGCLDSCLAVIKAPKFRRLLLLTIFLTFSSILVWIKILEPFVTAEKAALASLRSELKVASGGFFGTNVRPDFPGTIPLMTLDPKLLPRSPKRQLPGSKGKRRLIFVGDIHGCKDELLQLLTEMGFDSSTDHLIATGDMVSKGPDTLGVIDLLRELNASCVRGNHEDRLLLIADRLQSPSLEPMNQYSSTSGEEIISSADDREKKLALSLTADHLSYLRSCPVILRVGDLKALGGEVVVVHAGLVPGLPLERQDPASVMNMRIVDLDTHVPSKLHESTGSIPWSELWNKYQQLLPTQRAWFTLGKSKKQQPAEQHMTVIYGHDSQRGLRLDRYTKGLDTGCVRGGKLTALVVGEGGKEAIVQVQCKEYR